MHLGSLPLLASSHLGLGQSIQSGLHPIRDSRRKLLRPLVHGLIGHADCVCGSSRGAAEQPDGFSLSHAPLNHSSAHGATIVLSGSLSWATMVATSYKDRIRWALGIPEGGSPTSAQAHRLADALGVSYNAAKKLLELEGKTKSLTAENNAKAAALVEVDPDWLATGKGEARPAAPPDNLAFRDLNAFESQMITLFRQLSAKEQHDVLVALNNMIPKDGKASTANPFPTAQPRPRVRGVSQFGDLDTLPAAPKPSSGGQR